MFNEKIVALVARLQLFLLVSTAIVVVVNVDFLR